MAWRVARSLNVLLAQLNALAPNRSKVSDGSIGDQSHANRFSDHNPWYGPGIVTARDFTHDPANLNCHSVAARLVEHRDRRIKYIIWDRRIWTPAQGWRPYTGVNPHTAHLHLSVVASPLCDDETLWAGFTPPSNPEPEPEDKDVDPMQYARIVKLEEDSAVWWSVGNIRTWLPTEQTWNNVAYRIRAAGGKLPAGAEIVGDRWVEVVDDLDAFGIAAGPVPPTEG